MMNYRAMLLATVAATLMTSVGGVAVAADAATTAAATADTATTVGDIVVTARRKEESLERVPIAITAFTQDTLKEKAISNVYDLERNVPGLSVVAGSGVASSVGTGFAIRGRGQNYGAAAGSVETYFADVPLSGPFQMPSAGPTFFDLQSLQVLKGPQGTLFGRSTTGGAVLFVPQAPTDEFGGYVRLQGGDYGDFQAEGAINIPLAGDKAELRLAAFEWSRDGYGHTLGSIAGASPITGPFHDLFGNLLPPQTYDNENIQGFRATLKLAPIDKLSNSTIIAYNRDDNRNTPKAAVVNPNSALGGAALFLYPYLLSLGPHTAATDVNLDHAANHNLEVINTTTYQLTPDVKAKNIFGFIDAVGFTNESNDADGSPLAAIDLPTPPRQSQMYQYTDELQLQGDSFNNRLSWIAGGLIDLTRSPGGNDINLYTLNYSGVFDALWQQHHNDNYGLFGSLTYKITDKLSFTAGERHSWYGVNIFSQEAQAATAAIYLSDPGLYPNQATVANGWNVVNPGTRNSVSYQGDTYNFGLEYQADPETLVYGGYRRGFKPGGFNAKPPIGNAAGASFAPETDDDFYVGLKKNFTVASMTGRFNVEGYWDLYQNKQVSYLTLALSGGSPSLATETINVPATTYRGFDLDGMINLTPWLRLSANYSFIDAYVTNWTDNTFPGYTANLAINPVAYVSKNKVSVTARLHTELPGDKGELAIAPTISYQDKWYSIDNGFLLPRGETFYLGEPANFNEVALGGVVIPSYTIVDLRVEWNRVMGSRINAAFNATNIGNTAYALGSTGTLAFGVEGRAYGAPRMFNFELSTKF